MRPPADEAVPKVRAEALRGLADRRAAAAAPLMIEALLDKDTAVRMEAIRGLEMIGPDTAASALAIHLSGPGLEWQERDAAEKALATICLRAKDKDGLTDSLAAAMTDAAGQPKLSYLRVLGRLGGPKTVKAVMGAVNATNPDTREAAVRTLAAWPDAAAVDALLDIAWYNPETLHQPLPADARSLAVRGLVRLASSQEMDEGPAAAGPAEGLQLRRPARGQEGRPGRPLEPGYRRARSYMWQG